MSTTRRRRGRSTTATKPVPIVQAETGEMTEGATQFRAWIEANKIRHADLARELDCAKSYIAMLAGGMAPPGLGLAARIEARTGIACSAWTRPALAA